MSTATATPSTTAKPTALTRIVGLAKANGILMLRNRLTLSYGLLMPLLPLLFLLMGGGDAAEALGRMVMPTTISLALMFAVFYNLLSMVVTRRDEKVLKRLRTGEATDLEIITSMALPGVGITLAVTLLSAVVGRIMGVPLPMNPVLLVIAVLAGCLTVIGGALWTAAWTRTAESAQLTSMPVIMVMALGGVVVNLPASVQEWARFTPGAAIDELVRIAWFGEPYGSTVNFAGSWGAALLPLAVSLAWAAAAAILGWRSMQWEPRH